MFCHAFHSVKWRRHYSARSYQRYIYKYAICLIAVADLGRVRWVRSIPIFCLIFTLKAQEMVSPTFQISPLAGRAFNAHKFKPHFAQSWIRPSIGIIPSSRIRLFYCVHYEQQTWIKTSSEMILRCKALTMSMFSMCTIELHGDPYCKSKTLVLFKVYEIVLGQLSGVSQLTLKKQNDRNVLEQIQQHLQVSLYNCVNINIFLLSEIHITLHSIVMLAKCARPNRTHG